MKALKPNIDAIADSVVESLRSQRSVYVEGPVGSGRNSLVDRVQETLSNVVVLELLPLGCDDAAATAFIELSATLTRDDQQPLVDGSEREFYERARAIASRLRDAGRCLLVRLPTSWAIVAERADSDDGAAGRARAWLRGLLDAAAPMIVVADAAVMPRALGLHGWVEHRLPEHRVNIDALEGVAWGAFSSAFDALRRVARHPLIEASPLAWRIAVGLTALEGSPLNARNKLHQRQPLRELARSLGQLACKRDLSSELRRVLAVRRPIDAATLVRLSQVREQHASLVSDCLAYGTGDRRIAGPVRAGIADALGDSDADRATHDALWSHYGALDGASRPWGLAPFATQAWCEKLHHGAHGSDGVVALWAQQEKVAPEQYWERARALSRERYFGLAARAYQQCIERFGGDDYSHHYYAWNLARAGGRDELVERSFVKALELSPENPWWNSRLVTFLIRRGEHQRARDEWQRVIERIDVEAEETARSPWLARHLHRWVALAWLDAGCPIDAQSVWRLVPSAISDADPELKAIAERLAKIDVVAGREDPQWVGTLRVLDKYCGVDQAVAERARAVWSTLRHLGGAALPTPAVDGTADRQRIEFRWRYAKVSLRVEVDAVGEIEWYAHDVDEDLRVTGITYESLPELHEWLQRVVRV